jgi:hypothetical protein
MIKIDNFWYSHFYDFFQRRSFGSNTTGRTKVLAIATQMMMMIMMMMIL